jgi:outer membrane receptor protein involved in Fe transport
MTLVGVKGEVMSRVRLAHSLAITGFLIAASDPSIVVAEEKSPPGNRATTLPPVKVSPQPSQAKTQRVAPKKKLGAPAVQRAEGSTDRREGGDIDAGASRGLAPSPGRGELSPAASALPASSTTLGAKQLEQAPVASYGDIFRSLPGFNVASYGQGAIGYGLAMRGFTETEHGRDIAYFIDGVPVNEISSIHTQNYADLNVLIPETVKTLEVIRGPFSVEAGDSNVGGAVFITTKSSDPYAGLSFSGGSFGTGRGLATYGSSTGVRRETGKE